MPAFDEHSPVTLSEKQKESSFARDLAIKTAKAAATTAAITGATAIAGTASRKIGSHLGDRIADFVTGSSRDKNRRGRRRDREDDDNNKRHRAKRNQRTSRRGRSRMKRRNESSSVEALRHQNEELKEALKQTGVALVLANHLPKLEESKHRGFVSALRSYNEFESMVEFDEYVSGEVQTFLGEDTAQEPVEESTESLEESKKRETNPVDPLGLLNGSNGYMYERIVAPK